MLKGKSLFCNKQLVRFSSTFVPVTMNTVLGLTYSCGFLLVLTQSYTSVSSEYTTRRTRYGTIRGSISVVYGKKAVEAYMGIPFARPPLGKLRFEPPEPPLPWGTSVLDALTLPPACPQPTEGINYIAYHVPGFNSSSEDCLYLNIYLPTRRNSSPLPVMVFVHGGSYQNGMGAMLDGRMLALQDLVVVTFNYRLGPLGFLTSADDAMPGNYGMLDQVAALKWVRENIAFFGGDPASVTIDGHSAGGCCVGLHLLSPLSKGLFRKVIGQSGSPLAHWSVTRYQEGPDYFFKVVSASLGCAGNDTRVVKKCLQNIPTDKFEQFMLNEFEWTPSLVPQYRPIVDGYFLPDTPEKLIVSGELNADQYMTGATKDEGLIAAVPLVTLFGVGKKSTRRLLTLMNCFRGDLPEVRGIVDSVLEEYTKWPYQPTAEKIKKQFAEIIGDYFITAPTHLLAQILSARNVTVYMYNFEYRSVFDQWDGVVHGAEIFYLSGFPLTGHPSIRYEENDRTMAEMLLTLWANYIKYGIPSMVPSEEFHFLPYTIYGPVYGKMYKQDSHPAITMESNLKPEKLQFWNKKVPEMYKEQMGTINYIITDDVIKTSRVTVIHASPTWILTTTCVILMVVVILLSICYCKARKQVRTLLRWKETEVIS
ncbi:acetylcholinesterase-like [Liolophura sinensis]|uniref:acetylcholinesterase-like n=1 Tax=Liolophura sinensis TaxID=3198878 RepID=UPI0031597CE1